MAEGCQSLENDLITNISYDYSLINTKTGVDCIGSLYLSYLVPASTKAILVERTVSHFNGDNIRFLIKAAYSPEGESGEITIQDVYWGVYFRVCAILENGDRIYSPTYCTNEFIAINDLEMLMLKSDINFNNSNSLNYWIQNGILHLYTNESTQICIFDSYGMIIFNDIINESRTVSLDKVSGLWILISISSQTSCVTHKVLIR